MKRPAEYRALRVELLEFSIVSIASRALRVLLLVEAKKSDAKRSDKIIFNQRKKFP